MTIKDLWRRGQHGWPVDYPIAQVPNAPLLVALGGGQLAARTHGSVHDVVRAVSYTSLAAWAWGEVTGGPNWVRRGAGVVGFAFVIAQVAELVDS